MSGKTLDSIKELQTLEEGIYSKLHQKNLKKNEKETTLNELNSVSKVRNSLFDDLLDNYETLRKRVVSKQEEPEQEISPSEVIVNENDAVSSDISLLKSAMDNKQRMVEINTYYGKQYNAYTGIAMILLYTFTATFSVAILKRSSIINAPITNMLLFIVLVVSGVIIFFRVSDMLQRNNMNYDKYDWSDMPTDGKSLDDYVPPPSPVGGESINVDDENCIGEKCCDIGTNYDTSSKTCKPIVDVENNGLQNDTNINETFVSFESKSNSQVLPFSNSENWVFV